MLQLRVMLWPFIEKQNGNILIRQVNALKYSLKVGKNVPVHKKKLPFKLPSPLKGSNSMKR